MGLFGLFYSAVVLGAYGASGVKSCVENSNRRQQAAAKGEEFYLDDKCCLRLVSNDLKVMKSTLWDDCPQGQKGDRILRSVDDSRIIRNYTKEERDEREEVRRNRAIRKGRTAYRLGLAKDDYVNTNMPGCRYKDLKTGAIYVVRMIDRVNFYMDIKTGEFVRETDGEIIRNKQGKYTHDVEKFEQIRQKMNRRQKAEIARNGKPDPYRCYCNANGRDVNDYGGK